MKITIEQCECEWGERVTSEQNDALHDRYESLVYERLVATYPGAKISHSIQRRTSGSPVRVYVDLGTGEYDPREEQTADDVREILSDAWSETIENASDLLDATG